MRLTRQQVAENRARVLEAAARLFRERGLDGTGVDAVMAAAGLTHGGFYRHFPSKDALAAEALSQALDASEAVLRGRESLADYVASYLSAAHRDAPGAGCAVAALGAEAARQGTPLRARFADHVRRMAALLAGWMPGRDAAARERAALAALAQMVGALVLARAVDDGAMSDAILAAAQEALLRGDG